MTLEEIHKSEWYKEIETCYREILHEHFCILYDHVRELKKESGHWLTPEQAKASFSYNFPEYSSASWTILLRAIKEGDLKLLINPIIQGDFDRANENQEALTIIDRASLYFIIHRKSSIEYFLAMYQAEFFKISSRNVSDPIDAITANENWIDSTDDDDEGYGCSIFNQEFEKLPTSHPFSTNRARCLDYYATRRDHFYEIYINPIDGIFEYTLLYSNKKFYPTADGNHYEFWLHYIDAYRAVLEIAANLHIGCEISITQWDFYPDGEIHNQSVLEIRGDIPYADWIPIPGGQRYCPAGRKRSINPIRDTMEELIPPPKKEWDI
jgi:hypothetical protein